MMKHGMIVMSLVAVLFIMITACDDASRSRTDKDTAVTDTATTNDNDGLVQTDEVTTDKIVTDEIVTDEEETDAMITDEEKPDTVVPDNPVTPDDGSVTPDNDTPPLTCADITCEDENSHCEEGPNGAECVCNEGYHWNSGQCVLDTLTETGTFSFAFSGAINTTTDPMQLKGGEGDATFSHLGNQFTYSHISVFGDFGFPMATIQNGNTIMVAWIESFSMGGTLHFFGFSLPDTQNTPGTKQMMSTQAVAMYGDMAISGGGAQIQCIRSMSSDGSFTLADDTGNGTIHVTEANGKLYDPAVLGSNLPAPICEE